MALKGQFPRRARRVQTPLHEPRPPRRGRASSTRQQRAHSLRGFMGLWDECRRRSDSSESRASSATGKRSSGTVHRRPRRRGPGAHGRRSRSEPEGESLTVRGSKSPAATRTISLLPQLFPLVHEHLKFLRQRTVRRQRPHCLRRPRHAHDDELSVASGQACAYEAGVRPISCTCETTRQDRHHRGCPRTSSGENRSSVSPHTLRRTFGSDLINRGLRPRQSASLRPLQHDTERAYAQLLAPTIRRGVVRSVPARSVEDASGVAGDPRI